MKELLYGVMLLVMLIPAKAIIWKVIDETDPKNVWSQGIALFVIYAVAMGATVYVFCRGAATAEECMKRALVSLLVATVVALIPAIIIYLVKSKRNLSNIDKMKLKDM